MLGFLLLKDHCFSGWSSFFDLLSLNFLDQGAIVTILDGELKRPLRGKTCTCVCECVCVCMRVHTSLLFVSQF